MVNEASGSPRIEIAERARVGAAPGAPCRDLLPGCPARADQDASCSRTDVPHPRQPVHRRRRVAGRLRLQRRGWSPGELTSTSGVLLGTHGGTILVRTAGEAAAYQPASPDPRGACSRRNGKRCVVPLFFSEPAPSNAGAHGPERRRAPVVRLRRGLTMVLRERGRGSDACHRARDRCARGGRMVDLSDS